MADDRVTAILADTEAHGFVFEPKNLNKNGIALKQLPHITVTNWQKFDAAFPGIVKEHLNGTSTCVGSDRVSRDFAYDNQAMGREKRDAAIQRVNVEWLLGIKATRVETIVKFGGPEGTAYDTEEEAKSAWLEWAAKQ